MPPDDFADLLDFDPETIADEPTRRTVVRLLAHIEWFAGRVAAQEAENQRLRAEINRLKGEHGGPTHRPKGPKGPSRPIIAPVEDHSSEAERQVRKPWKKASKLDRIPIHHTLPLPPPAGLPADAVFKGYEPVTVQDLEVRLCNTRFLQAKFYSPATGKTHHSSLPAGYEGGFGPGVKSLTLMLHHGNNTTLPAIHRFYTDTGLLISRGTIARLVTENLQTFHAEAAAVTEAGLSSSPWQHIDATPTKVDGQPHACHTVGNPLFTAYLTTPAQDRATIVDVLRGGAPRRYLLDATTLSLLKETSLGARVQERLARLLQSTTLPLLDAEGLQRFVAAAFPRLGRDSRKIIADVAAVAAYRADPNWPVIRCLVSDDAAQFHGVTEEQALCWVHDARHYKKLVTQFACHRRALAQFRKRYWAFYRELQAYREAPSLAEAQRLEAAFDRLFGTEVSYADLNTCIARTRANKEKLLLVLTHPELPLHNNPAELAARRRVRKRDASFGPRSAAGVKAWDTFQTLLATAGQLGISFYEYLQDRITAAGKIPLLAEVITERAQALRLGESWNTS